MRKLLVSVMLLCFLMSCGYAFAESDNDIVIKRGTEVLVKIMQRVKSNKVHEGEVLRFSVERSVKNDDGFVLIQEGAFAYGVVTKAAKAGIFGAGGKLGITINSVEAYNGKIVQLTGNNDNDGESATGASVAGAVLLTPLTLFFRGTNAVIESGTIFTTFVANTTVLEERPAAETKIEEAPPQPAPQPAPAVKKKTAKKKTTKKKTAKK